MENIYTYRYLINIANRGGFSNKSFIARVTPPHPSPTMAMTGWAAVLYKSIGIPTT